jgi:hypothetical protein
MFYGYYTFSYFQQISSGHNLDCFFNFGAYKICTVSQRLSIYSSMLLLMTQVLVSRMLLPGISNFVNASVRCLQQPACLSRCVCEARLSYRPQVLRLTSNEDMAETLGMGVQDEGVPESIDVRNT